jgi:hypothetical protein
MTVQLALDAFEMSKCVANYSVLSVPLNQVSLIFNHGQPLWGFSELTTNWMKRNEIEVYLDFFCRLRVEDHVDFHFRREGDAAMFKLTFL